MYNHCFRMNANKIEHRDQLNHYIESHNLVLEANTGEASQTSLAADAHDTDMDATASGESETSSGPAGEIQQVCTSPSSLVSSSSLFDPQNAQATGMNITVPKSETSLGPSGEIKQVCTTLSNLVAS
jgi:hypothetical protein